MSRMRFRGRRSFMNFVLILGMFPGIMSVVAIYFILKAMGLTTVGKNVSWYGAVFLLKLSRKIHTIGSSQMMPSTVSNT
mgnify:CR=1 FL=1